MTIKTNSFPSSEHVVNSTTTKMLVNYLISKNLEQRAIEEILDYDLSNLDSPDSTIPLRIYKQLWDIAVEHTQDEHLGIKLANNPYNSEMSLVSHVFFNSHNLREGLKQYIRYYALINEAISVQLSSFEDKAVINYHCHNPIDYCKQDVEHSLALSVTRIKEHLSTDIKLDEVHFQHDCNNLKFYVEFFDCPVYFNQKNSALIFKNKYLDYIFPKKSTHLFNFLTSHLELLLTKLKKQRSFTEKASQLIEHSLSSGNYDAEKISASLHMSRHTLYRKLKAEGASFHELLDGIRKKKAMELMKKNQHSLSEIAFLLGFSELSSFSRAFKKWTGCSPNSYLKR